MLAGVGAFSLLAAGVARYLSFSSLDQPHRGDSINGVWTIVWYGQDPVVSRPLGWA